MAYTDSNVTARLTVDILSSLKTCPAPLFPSLCSDCQTIVRGIALVGGGVGGGVGREGREGEIAAFIVF